MGTDNRPHRHARRVDRSLRPVQRLRQVRDQVLRGLDPVEAVRRLHFDLVATGLFQPDPYGASWLPHMTISVAPGGAEQTLEVAASLATVETVCRSLALVPPDASGRFVTRSFVPDAAGSRIPEAWDA